MAYDVFISHSSKDKTIADAACACLESRGIRCWVAPRDIVAGVDWGSSIIDGINGTKVMVLILSSHSNVSKHVLREIERAAHRGMPVLPLRVEDVTLSKSLEYFLSSAHWLDAYKGPLKQHLENLANNTAILLEKREAVHPLSDSPSKWQRFALRPMIIAGVSTALLTVAAGLGIAWYMLKDTHSIGMELIELPAGKFTMGSPLGEKDRSDNNEDQVAVTLTKPFGLGKTEVTQGQWKSVMGTEPWYGQDLVKADKDRPATNVSCDDATEFCQKLTEIERKSGKLKANEEYRLPTEAEWEYACRAGTETAFPFGNDESKLGEYGWFNGNTGSQQYTHKVGLKKPNPWGLYDMHGNVWEQCSDQYGEDLAGGTDPVGPKGDSSRVVRGGSWRGDPADCRSAGRGGNKKSNRLNNSGFRVARSQSARTVAQAWRAQPDVAGEVLSLFRANALASMAKAKNRSWAVFLCDSSAHQRPVAIASHFARVSSPRPPHLQGEFHACRCCRCCDVVLCAVVCTGREVPERHQFNWYGVD